MFNLSTFTFEMGEYVIMDAISNSKQEFLSKKEVSHARV